MIITPSQLELTPGAETAIAQDDETREHILICFMDALEKLADAPPPVALGDAYKADLEVMAGKEYTYPKVRIVITNLDAFRRTFSQTFNGEEDEVARNQLFEVLVTPVSLYLVSQVGTDEGADKAQAELEKLYLQGGEWEKEAGYYVAFEGELSQAQS